MTLLRGDCLALLSTLGDASVDSIVTDPPYELSNDGKASANRVLLEVMFPENTKSDIAGVGKSELSFFVEKVLGLSQSRVIPTPPATMPISPVTLNDQIECGNENVINREETSICVSDDLAGFNKDTEVSKYLGRFALKLADPTRLFNILTSIGTGFHASGIGVGFGISPTSFPSLATSSTPIPLSENDIRFRNDSLANLVSAFSGTGSYPVFGFDLTRGAIETFTADGARLFAAILLASGAELVRADSATSSLPTMLESRRISVIDDLADGAFSFDLIIHTPTLASTGFMGKSWDGSKIAFNVELWQECLRVLKPGGHLLAFGGSRTYHRMVVAIEDAGFEIRDQIQWIYGCLDDQTELLVDGGWVRHDQIHLGENALCFDKDTDTFSWQPVQRVVAFDYTDTAYRVKGRHTDQLLTKEHRCIAMGDNGWEFVEAQELAKSGLVAVPVIPNPESLIEWSYGRGQSSSEFGMRLVRYPDVSSPIHTGNQRWQVLLSWLSKHGASQHGSTGSESQTCRCEQSRMEGWGDHLQKEGQLLQREVCALPARVLGDGSQGRVCDGAPSVRGASDRTAPDAGGDCASRGPRPHEQHIDQSHVVCHESGPQTVRASRFTEPDLVTVTPEPYDGTVWCVTVPTGAFVARRNGKVFVTGNSGFPKSLDVSKAIDKAAGAEREVFSSYERKGRSGGILGTATEIVRDITAPATPEAQQWEGWGTALKPAHEPIVVARKPLIGTVAANVLEWGTGALNIDGCRVGTADGFGGGAKGTSGFAAGYEGDGFVASTQGRWPANVMITHSHGCRQVGIQSEQVPINRTEDWTGFGQVERPDYEQSISAISTPVWECVEGCPTRSFPDSKGMVTQKSSPLQIYGGNALNKSKTTMPEVRIGFNDSGSAARFFSQTAYDEPDFPDFIYQAKANKKERNAGLEGIACTHPTVKPLALMRQLVRLVTPPNGIVLDPFLGSGTTACAAILEGFEWVGCEMTEDYWPIIEARVEWAQNKRNTEKATPTLFEHGEKR